MQKFLTVLLGVLSLTYLPFVLIGLWNRLFGGWQSIFFCYAGNASYGRAYGPAWIADLFRWRPSPIAVLPQGGKRGLVVASNMTEADFLNPANAADFERFQRRLGRAARLMGVAQIHMAGILPSTLRHKTTLTLFPARDVIADLVVAAAHQIVADRFQGRWPPVIILGASGFIGTPITAALAAHKVYPVDPALGITDLPDLGGRPALLIDAARAGTLTDYLSHLWPGLVVLNEAFPEPNRATRARLRDTGVELWHLAGAKGRMHPPLPGAYGDAVPCCAVHRPDADLEPVLRLLEPGKSFDAEDAQFAPLGAAVLPEPAQVLSH